MSLFFKIILVIFGLAYLVSPVDIIPDLLLPYVGWLDDGAVIAAIIYMMRTGKLPDFKFFKKASKPQTPPRGKSQEKQYSRFNREQTEKSDFAQAPPREPDRMPPHEILGIHPDATKKEIHRAYKDAIKKYHPDKLSHLGEEFSTLANKKFLEVQQAYEAMIKTARR